MKFVLKTARIGVYSSAVLLIAKLMTTGSAVAASPMIAITSVTPGVNNPVTLQYTTNLSASAWQTLGFFSGSTNLLFDNLPAIFVRGVSSNLTVSATLSWPASTDTSVARYKVYYGVASGVYTSSLDVGLATNAIISNLIAGRKYYFTVTTSNSSGVESPYSKETSASFQTGYSLAIAGIHRVGGTTMLMVTQALQTAAVAPPPMVILKKRVTADITDPITLQFATNLSMPHWQPLGTFSSATNISFTNLPAVFIRGYCTNLMASATLAWQSSSNPIVTGYKLYYGTISHNYTSVVNVGASTRATISNLVPGKTYYFAVTAYDSSGLESSFSSEASGTFQPAFSLTIGSP